MTIPVPTHRTYAWYSLLRNWHNPFELPPYQSQSSMDLSSWMLKDSIPTSGLNSKSIPFMQNASTISQAPSGPSILMVYYVTLDTSMFQTPAISDYMFSSTHMTIPLTSFRSDEDPSSSPYAILLVWTSSLHQGLLQIMHHLFPHQTCAPQTLWTSQATSNSREALEFHIHGFNREAPSIFQLHLNSSHC